jgi:hypothetical protein
MKGKLETDVPNNIKPHPYQKNIAGNIVKKQ